MRVKLIWAISLFLIGVFYQEGNTQIDRNLITAPSDDSTIQRGGPVQIQGKIYNQTYSSVVLKFYKSVLNLEEEYYSLPLNESGFFSMQFWAVEPMVVTVLYGEQEHELFIQPNDNLFLSFRGTQMRESLAFSGQGYETNQYLIREERDMAAWSEEAIYYELIQRPSYSYKQFIDSLYSVRQAFYRDYPPLEKQKFSQAFLDYIYADRIYSRAYQLLQYRTEHPIAFGRPAPEKLPNSYYQFLADIPIENTNALRNEWYRKFIEELQRWRNEHPTFTFSKPIQVAEVKVPSLMLLQAPDQPPILDELPQHTELLYLNQRSEKVSKIMVGDEIKEDHWYKVATSEGKEGWVTGVGIQFKSHPLTRSHQFLFKGDIAAFLAGKAALWETPQQDSLFWVQLAAQVQSDPLRYILQQGTEYRQMYKPMVRPFKKRPSNIAKAPRVKIDTLKAQPIASNDSKTSQISSKSNTVAAPPKLRSPKTETKSEEPSQSWVSLPAPTSTKEERTTVIQFTGETPATLSLTLYQESILFQQRQFSFIQNGNNRIASFPLGEYQTGFIEIEATKIPVYISPGDAMKVQSKQSNEPSLALHYSGKGSIHNQFLFDFHQAFAATEKALRKHIEEDDPFAFQQWLQAKYQEKLAFFNAYENRSLFTPSFTAFAKGEIEYWYGYNLLNYPWEHPIFHDQDIPMNVDPSYYANLKYLKISNGEALPSPNYSYFLSQFFEYQQEQVEHYGRSEMALAKQFLNGKALEYYQAKLLAIQCKRGRALQLGNDIEQFMAQSTEPAYQNLLSQVYSEARGLSNGVSAPSFNLTDLHGKEWRLEDLKGKVVYLDFWATWCMSCTYQMRNSKEWKKAYRKDEVAFVYISLDQDLNTWKTFLASNDINGIHLANNGASAKSNYKVKKLPAIFVIDQAGRLVYQSYQDSGKVRVKDLIDRLVRR